MRAPTVRGLAAAMTAIAALAGACLALETESAPVVSGAPDEYVTLGFALSGSGRYDYDVEAPDPWSPLQGEGTVAVDGEGYVSVTLRVPERASGGSTTDVVLHFVNVDDEDDRLTARGTIRVRAQPRIGLLAPASLAGERGEPLTVPITVRNAGNLRDTVVLTVEPGMWTPRTARRELPLEPAEARDLEIELRPTGRVSPGYRQLLRVTARSTADPDVTERAAVELTFGRRARSEDAPGGAAPPPGLALSLSGGLQVGAELTEGDVSPSLDYFVRAGLHGDLSDYVSARASVGSLGGDLSDPFTSVPSQLDLGLVGESWDARLALGPEDFGLGGGALVGAGAWRIGGDLGYRPTSTARPFRVNGYAYSQRDDLDLRFNGSTSVGGDDRRDRLSARYQTPLGSGATLQVGTDLLGTVNDAGYRVDAGLAQQLAWQSQTFDVVQSYSGLPTAGLHVIGVSGGLRSTEPVGLRAAGAVRIEGGTVGWDSDLAFSARPAPPLGVSLNLGYAAREASSRWRVSPGASYRFGLSGLRGSLAVRYRYTGPVVGGAAAESSYVAGLSGRAGPWSAAAAAEYLTSDGGAAGAPFDRWTWAADAGVDLGRDGSLELSYEREATTGEEAGTESGLSAVWRQAWGDAFVTALAYDRRWTAPAEGSAERDEQIRIAAALDDVGIEGLTAGLSYEVASDTGLLGGASALTHEIRASVSYAFEVPFETPAAAVDLFGGRRGGSVTGTVYVDRDLDGRYGAGDEALTGVPVELAGVTTLTDGEGDYRLRVPSGRHAWTVQPRLQVRYAPRFEPTLRVDEDSEQRVDLRFVPVVGLSATVFDDLDRDGTRDPGEPGIPFAGVRVEGPTTRTARSDDQGAVTITGLVPGEYRVAPDPDRLPRRYRATSEPRELTLRAGEVPAPIEVGAAAEPKEVITTFTPSQLSVLPSIRPTSVPAGGEIVVSALVSGAPERVTARVAGVDVELAPSQGQWSATIRVPRDASLGRLEVPVTVQVGDERSTSPAVVTVVDRPLVQPSTLRVARDRPVDVHLELAFTAERVELRFDDRSIDLEKSASGAWTGRVLAIGDGPPPSEAQVLADGETLGPISIVVTETDP